MKNILLFASCYCVLSCKPVATPPQNVAQPPAQPNITSVIDTVTPNMDKDMDSEDATPKIPCDAKANLIEKFEQPNGTLLERFSFKEGSDMSPEWIKISVPNQPCKIVDIRSTSRKSYQLEDWDKDGFKDLICNNFHHDLFYVCWFDETKNDFIIMDAAFGGKWEAFDTSKFLFIAANDRNLSSYYGGFRNDYTLFYFKKGVFKILGQVAFLTEHDGAKKIETTVKKYKSAQDTEGTMIQTKVFNPLALKVETLYNQHASEVKIYEGKLKAQLSEAQRSDLTNQYNKAIRAMEMQHTQWAAVTKPMVIQYLKDNLETFLAK